VLKAVIPQGVQVQPAFVFWQTGEAANPKTITVRGSEEAPLTNVDVTSSSADFTTRVEKGSTPSEFLIHVQPKSTESQLSATLSIKAGAPRPYQVMARVTGRGSAEVK
jgi:hypothetical protein